MSSERETLKVQSCLFEVTPSPPSVQRTVARTEAKTHEDAARRPADDVTDDDSAECGYHYELYCGDDDLTLMYGQCDNDDDETMTMTISASSARWRSI